MTAVLVYILPCDHAGCLQSFGSGAARATDARRAAKLAGWRHRIWPRTRGLAPSLDFCPDHASDADADEPPGGWQGDR